jgi:thymidylate kinase
MTSKGFSVALIGCDGAGKTTVARTLERETDLPLHYLYMGVSSDSSNRQLPTTKLAHRIKRARGAAPDTAGPQPPKPPPGPASPLKRLRRSTRSTLRLTNRLAEEWYRQLIAMWALRRGSIVVFDRHFVADYHAADMAAEQRTLARRVHGWLLLKTYPHPDLIVFLDAPAEVLFARKGEGTIASLTRRREEYMALRNEVEDFVVVPATQPLGDVVEQVEGIIRGYGAAR